MIRDKLNIFPLIAQRIKVDFPKAKCWFYGSRLGNKKGVKNDFDIVVTLDYITRKEYITNIKNYRSLSNEIKKEFLLMKDEFSNFVVVDIFFSHIGSKIEKDTLKNSKNWKEIKI